MKTFGLVVPAGKGSRFEEHVRELLVDQVASLPSSCLSWRPGAVSACMHLSSDVN
jgi:transposase